MWNWDMGVPAPQDSAVILRGRQLPVLNASPTVAGLTINPARRL